MSNPVEALRRALEGRYRVERELGEGGMATVYLAHDLRHERKVALKVLRPELAAVVGGDRFLAEIKTTANLQHPHVLPLFDSGEADSFLFYVMPYVEGESLREKLERERQLPVEEALALTRKVGAALEYAHEQGIVHRDIKPANILVSRGEPLVADFGIALAISSAGGGRITETGLSMGTPHYMSPEQAAGERGLDKRSDVYALGCVLYEMLAGQPPYAGPTAQAVLAQILTERPRHLTDLRGSVPRHVADAVARCLEKLPADRFESADAFVRALDDPSFRHGVGAGGPRGTLRADGDALSSGSEGLRRIGVAAVVLLLAGLAAWGWLRPTGMDMPLTVMRMALPDSQALALRSSPRFDLSPDGRSMVYVGPGAEGGMLWYREFGQLDARPLAGTDGAHTPVFAPDGRSVAYVTGTPGDLRIVGLGGSAPVTVVQDSAYAYGMTWADDGWIYVTNDVELLRVRAQGGALSPATVVDSARSELWRGWPHAVPGGRYVLFSIWRGTVDEVEVAIRDMEGEREAILTIGLSPRYAPTGHLIFTRADGTLMAAPLDLDALSLTAEPTTVFGGVSVNSAEGYAEMDVSEAGTVLYQSGGSPAQDLVWVDRDGTATPVDTSFSGDLQGVVLSADARTVAAAMGIGGNPDVYVKQLSGGPWRRVTFESRGVTRPSWVPGGERIMFISDRNAAGPAGEDLWTTDASGTGDIRPVLDLDARIQEGTWSPDGEWLVYRVGPAPGETRDLYAISGRGQGDTLEVAVSRFQEHSPSVSPDGGWIVYVSDESGRPEVFVRPFPRVEGGKVQVSASGGSGPVWSRGTPELFYRSGSGAMTAARYQDEPSFAVVETSELFVATPYELDPLHASYDVTPDGQRFLLARNRGGDADLVLIQNWFEELQARMGEGER